MTERVRQFVDRAVRTDMCIIPGGLTSHLQPADVSWNKPFKTAYRDLYNCWMASREHSYTKAGNMKAPDKVTCLKWVKKAWDSVKSDVIINSFKVCGISVATDGSEDGLIHCLKPGEVAAEAASDMARLTSALQNSEESDDDPFSGLDSDEDQEEIETNEILVEDD